MKPIYFTWTLIAVVNYARAITRWRKGVHKQKVVGILNKLFILFAQYAVCDLSPILLLSDNGAVYQFILVEKV